MSSSPDFGSPRPEEGDGDLILDDDDDDYAYDQPPPMTISRAISYYLAEQQERAHEDEEDEEQGDECRPPPSKRRLLSIEQSLNQLEECGQRCGWILADLPPSVQSQRRKGARFFESVDLDSFPPVLFEFFDGWLSADGPRGRAESEEDDEEDRGERKIIKRRKIPLSNVAIGRVARDILDFLAWLCDCGYLESEEGATKRLFARALKARKQARRADRAFAALLSFAEVTSLLFGFSSSDSEVDDKREGEENDGNSEDRKPKRASPAAEPDPRIHRRGWMVVENAVAASAAVEREVSFGVASFRKSSHVMLRPSFDVFFSSSAGISAEAGGEHNSSSLSAELEAPDQVVALLRPGDRLEVELKREKKGVGSGAAASFGPWRLVGFFSIKASGWDAALDETGHQDRDEDTDEVGSDGDYEEQALVHNDDEAKQFQSKGEKEESSAERAISSSSSSSSDAFSSSSSSTSTAAEQPQQQRPFVFFKAARFGAFAPQHQEAASEGVSATAIAGIETTSATVEPLPRLQPPPALPRQGPPPFSWEDEAGAGDGGGQEETPVMTIRGGAGLGSINRAAELAKSRAKAPVVKGPSRMLLPKPGGTSKHKSERSEDEEYEERHERGNSALATLLTAAARPNAYASARVSAGSSSSSSSPFPAHSSASLAYDDDPMQLLMLVPGMRELAAIMDGKGGEAATATTPAPAPPLLPHSPLRPVSEAGEEGDDFMFSSVVAGGSSPASHRKPNRGNGAGGHSSKRR